MALTRYYIPPGMFKTSEELMNAPNTPDKDIGVIWKRYSEGKCYLSIWHTDESILWGYFSLSSLHWAVENGYQPFVNEVEEVMI